MGQLHTQRKNLNSAILLPADSVDWECGVWSGSTLFSEACLSKYLANKVLIQILQHKTRGDTRLS